MTWPASLTLVTVTGQLGTPPDGDTPDGGRATFTLPTSLQVAADNAVILPIPVVVPIGADGSFTAQLPANNDPQATPQGGKWRVELRSGTTVVCGVMALDYQTTSVDLAAVFELDGAIIAGVTYIPLTQKGVYGGVARLDPTTGEVLDGDGNPVSGGGGGGTPSGTVVSETTYGQSASAGNATAYSRGNHTHGTPAAPSAADISDATTVGRNVLKAADAAAARTAIGAGTSSLVIGTTGSTAAAGNDSRLSDARTPTAHASSHADGGADEISIDGSQITSGTLAIAQIPTGTSSTTVAVGNDSRITGAAQKASNLSDLASASTARSNLGLGGAATLAVGTSTGTVAAGDDSRLTGAAQKSSNLSDLANASTARTNLGLGDSATKNVGTGSTNVAAGDAPASAAITAVSAHIAGDPHPQYLVTYVENGGTYAIVNGARIFVGADDPSGKGFTLVDGDLWFPGS